MQFKLRFWGKSIEVQPKGVVTLELLEPHEWYTWQNPNLTVHNVLMGKIWIEHVSVLIGASVFGATAMALLKQQFLGHISSDCFSFKSDQLWSNGYRCGIWMYGLWVRLLYCRLLPPAFFQRPQALS